MIGLAILALFAWAYEHGKKNRLDRAQARSQLCKSFCAPELGYVTREACGFSCGQYVCVCGGDDRMPLGR